MLGVIHSMFRIALRFFIVVLASSCATGGSKRLTKKELAAFVGPDSHTSLHWSRTNGPDFTVYHGKSTPPLTGGVGFYIGMHPSFVPAAGSTTHRGHLGVFSVLWHRKLREDGSLYQTARISLRGRPSIHVWVYGPGESDVDTLIQQLGTLPQFSRHAS